MFPFYVHTQVGASTTWTISHGLGVSSLVVEVWNGANEVIFPNQIEKTNANTTTITFTTAVSGHAVVVASVGANSYTHVQGVASASWSIPHALSGLNLIMTVYDNGAPARVIVPDEIELVDANNSTVTFTTAVAGSVSIINAIGLQAYAHTQGIAADPWSVTHGLDSFDNLVSLWDNGATRNRIYSDGVTLPTSNTSQVDWTVAQDGFASFYSVTDHLPGPAGAASGVVANSAKPLRAVPGVMVR